MNYFLKLSPDIVLKLGHYWALLPSCCFSLAKKSRTLELKVFGEIWYVHWTFQISILHWTFIMTFTEILTTENFVCFIMLNDPCLHSSQSSSNSAESRRVSWNNKEEALNHFVSPRPEMCGEETCSLHYRLIEEGLLVFAVPMAWFYLMFFAG